MKFEVATSTNSQRRRIAGDEELRRCYNLCFNLDNKELQDIAKNSIRFVKVTQKSAANDR